MLIKLLWKAKKLKINKISLVIVPLIETYKSKIIIIFIKIQKLKFQQNWLFNQRIMVLVILLL